MIWRTPGRGGARHLVAPLVLVAALALGGCSGGESDGDATTTTAEPARDLLLAGDPALVGRWVDDVSELVASSLAEGLDAPPTCEAETALEFEADGSFSYATTGRCEFAEGAGDLVIEAEGTYGASDGNVEVRTTGGRSVLVGDDGEELTIAGPSISDGEVPYVVEGDVLELGDAATGGTVSYRRG